MKKGGEIVALLWYVINLLVQILACSASDCLYFPSWFDPVCVQSLDGLCFNSTFCSYIFGIFNKIFQLVCLIWKFPVGFCAYCRRSLNFRSSKLKQLLFESDRDRFFIFLSVFYTVYSGMVVGWVV